MKSKKIVALILVFSMVMLPFKYNVKVEAKDLLDNPKKDTQLKVDSISAMSTFRIKNKKNEAVSVRFLWDKSCFHALITSFVESGIVLQVGERLSLKNLGLDIRAPYKSYRNKVYLVYNKNPYQKAGYYLETVKVVDKVAKKSDSKVIGVVVVDKDSEPDELEPLTTDMSGDRKVVVKNSNIRKLTKNQTMYIASASILRSTPNVQDMHFGKVLDIASYGKKVKVLGWGTADNDYGTNMWCKVKYKGKIGYIDSHCLSNNKPKIYKGSQYKYIDGMPYEVKKGSFGATYNDYIEGLTYYVDVDKRINESYFYQYTMWAGYYYK